MPAPRGLLRRRRLVSNADRFVGGTRMAHVRSGSIASFRRRAAHFRSSTITAHPRCSSVCLKGADGRHRRLGSIMKQASRLRRAYGSKLSAVSRKTWRTVPDLSAISSRHSGLSPSLSMMSRIMSEHTAAASSQAVSSSGKSTSTSLEQEPWRNRNV
jgi:hypothetical protein